MNERDYKFSLFALVLLLILSTTSCQAVSSALQQGPSLSERLGQLEQAAADPEVSNEDLVELAKDLRDDFVDTAKETYDAGKEELLSWKEGLAGLVSGGGLLHLLRNWTREKKLREQPPAAPPAA